MRTLTLLLDDQLDAWLRSQAERRGVSVRTVLADLVRQAAQAPAEAAALAPAPAPLTDHPLPTAGEPSPEPAPPAPTPTPAAEPLAAPAASVVVDSPPAELVTLPPPAPEVAPGEPLPVDAAAPAEEDEEGEDEEEDDAELDGEDDLLAEGAPEATAASAAAEGEPKRKRRRRRRRGGRGRRGATAAATTDAPTTAETTPTSAGPVASEEPPALDTAAGPDLAAPAEIQPAPTPAAATEEVAPVAHPAEPNPWAPAHWNLAPGVTPAAAVAVTPEPAATPVEPAPPTVDPEPALERRPDRASAGSAEIEEELARFDVHAIPQHPVETTAIGFAELGLSPTIVDRLREIAFLHPTPIQAAVIPHALAGRDVVGLAETGSGKTAAFVLPLAEKLRHGRGIRGLIIAPTRELALQTHAFIDILGRDRELEAVSLVGGLALGPQADRLVRRPDFVVATPGRLVDHLERGNLRLDQIEHLVLDEADHMLDLGFLPQVLRILEEVPAARQTLLFSATMPPPIARIATQFQRDPVRVDITPEGKAAAGISHRLYLVRPDDKKACLLALLHHELGSTLVFIRRRSDAEWLTGVLEREGHPVARIHSDLTQAQRLKALSGFREGEHRILVATDVASRGIDVPAIRHVINFDPPDSVEDYIHRAGRTARGSALGIVSTIATFLDKPMVAEIEHALGETIPRCTVPGVEPYVEPKLRPTIRRRRLSF
jgi:ATP-dependent RNA helicase RhlE